MLYGIGKEKNAHIGQKVGCGFVAPEVLASRSRELLYSEQLFLEYCLDK